jgi:hypothetical protein
MQSNANILPYYMGRTSGNTLSKNGRSEVFFRNTSGGGLYGETYWWYDGSYRLIEADIVFYTGNYRFYNGSSGCSGSGIYLQDATTHEFGHALGLGHSSVSTASMSPTMQWCSTSVRSLDSDDLAGIEKLYPAGGGNTAPTVTITSPGTGLTLLLGTSVTFAGTATDKEDGNITNRLVWRSSLDGQIGTGASFTRSLSLGLHVITASVTDSSGAAGSRQISLTVSLLASAAPAPGISLSARGYKSGGRHYVNLTWSGAETSYVFVLRNGTKIVKTPNDGKHTDTPSTGGTYKYKVCQTGTLICSNRVDVKF